MSQYRTLQAGDVAEIESARAGLTAADAEEDAELVAEFCQEAEQYFTAAEAALLGLERNPEDAEAIGVVFRAFHTVKGVSALLGLDAISALAHEAESFLMPVREGRARFARGRPELALGALDMLRKLVARISEAPATHDLPLGYRELRERLEAGTRALGTLAPPGVALGDDAVVPAQAPPVPAQAPPVPAQAPPVPAQAPPVPAQAPPGGASPSRQEESIRISAERLDMLLDMVSELVIAQAMVTEDPSFSASRLRELNAKVTQCAKIVKGLQDLSLGLRMVPLRGTFQKMGRVLRDTAQKLGKNAELVLEGEQTEVDRKLADALVDPLVHMLRNAVDHGLEGAEERRLAGKAGAGTVRLEAQYSGGNVVIRLSDDGRGLSREKILSKARRVGLLGSEAQLSDNEILNLIFRPGFSTSDTVTDISGRGVGMDVVKRAVESLNGRIELSSEPGRGTAFAIHVPLTLAITDGMLVRVATERYIIPAASIYSSFRPHARQLKTLAERGEMVMLDDAAIPLLRLSAAFAIPGAEADPTRALLVVVGSGTDRRALLVDDLLGKYQVVTKSLGEAVGSVIGVCGGAILGDGLVGLIVDPPGLLRADAHAADIVQSSAVAPAAAPSSPAARAGLAGKQLTFCLGEEEYGIPVLSVHEIVRMLDITRVPNAPPSLSGVANLRGKILPVFDLRLKLGMSAAPVSEETRIVVVASELGVVGLVVDRVTEVEDVSVEAIEAMPRLGARVPTEYVLGVGVSRDRAQFLLDVGRIVGSGRSGLSAASL